MDVRELIGLVGFVDPVSAAGAAGAGRPCHGAGRDRRQFCPEPRRAVPALRALSEAVQDPAVEHGRQLRPVGRAAVRVDGPACDPRQSQPRSVPRHERHRRSIPRRRCHGGGRRLRRVRRRLRIVARHGFDHGTCGPARVAAAQLCAEPGDRCARCGRHLGHPDPALDCARRLCRRRRGLDRPAVPGGDHSGPAGDAVLHPGHRHSGAAEAGPGAEGSKHSTGRSAGPHCCGSFPSA